MFEFMSAEERNIAVERIIRAEWEMFQKVQNTGRRAECQDEWPTFRIMRYSQYASWTDEMIKSFESDIKEALKTGRNLVTEKYAYMMEFTSNEYYRNNLEPYLPKVNGEAILMIYEITKYLVRCEKELALKYPKLASMGRPAETAAESGDVTSAEIYLIGELKTYSENTLKIYLDYVRKSKAEGHNIVLTVKDIMVKMYGYNSIEDAEDKI